VCVCLLFARQYGIKLAKNFVGFNHITGMAKPKVVKICTQVGYFNFRNMMTYHLQKGCGYGHMNVLKFCHLHDAAHCVGLSAKAELRVNLCI